uniref:Trafficking protein particle complex subunit 6B, like n=1 Tax=Callorhinchus milii TaxID=7868 RepID=A0A4W3GFN4_CALMI
VSEHKLLLLLYCYNHRTGGTYVLQDNRFRLLTQISSGKQYLEEAPKFLAFSCGLLRGALCNLGIDSTVTAEVSVMPACDAFQVGRTSQ